MIHASPERDQQQEAQKAHGNDNDQSAQTEHDTLRIRQHKP